MQLTTLLALVAAAAPAVLAKPEQIRAVTSPVFHYYLQAYPKNGQSSLHGLASPLFLFISDCP